MSGIYIPGMEMPTRCENCVIFDPEMDECALIGKTPWSWEDETGISTIHRRPENCPLIPVPDHGRLIDADALIVQTNQHYAVLEDDWYITVRKIETVPTIIPADKEGEG